MLWLEVKFDRITWYSADATAVRKIDVRIISSIMKLSMKALKTSMATITRVGTLEGIIIMRRQH